MADALSRSGLSPYAAQVVPVADRDVVTEMLKLEDKIDLIIPRGGEGLIRFVAENSRIPVLKHYKGGLPRLRGRARGSRDGRGYLPQREGAETGGVQLDGDNARSLPLWRVISCPQ